VRAVHVIALCVLLVLVGLMLAFGRSCFLPARPPAAPTTSSAFPPTPSAPEPRSTGPGQQVESTTPATAALACIQNALGGVQEFAGVTSFRIVGKTKPTAPGSGWSPVSNKREIIVVFPDRYRHSNVQTDTPPGSAPLTSIVGFDGDEILSSVGAAGKTMSLPPEVLHRGMADARRSFVRTILTRLPREMPGVRLSQRTMLDSGQERLAIDAFGPSGLDATLLADLQTCMPVALQYSEASVTGPARYRRDLSEYRRFGGILFPTVLKITRDGAPYEDEQVSEVKMNASIWWRLFSR